MATPIPNPPPETLSEQSDPKPALRKPEFKKVDQLKPGTGGHTLTVKVLASNTVLAKGRSVSQHLRQTRIAECLVGDETGAIIFTARNEQGISFCSFYVSFFVPFFFQVSVWLTRNVRVHRGRYCALCVFFFGF